MPEEQKPFTHADGSQTPKPPVQLLATHTLAGCSRAVDGILADTDDALLRLMTVEQRQAARGEVAALRDIRGILSVLQQPTMNCAVNAITSLPPGDASIIGDLCTALVGASTKRPKIIAAVRAAIEAAT